MFEEFWREDENENESEGGSGFRSHLSEGGGVYNGEPSWLFAEQTFGEALDSGRLPWHDDASDGILERPARMFGLPPVRIDLFEE